MEKTNRVLAYGGTAEKPASTELDQVPTEPEYSGPVTSESGGKRRKAMAVYGRTAGGGLAGGFDGGVEVSGKISTGDLDVAGTITVAGDVLLKNRDLAEQFDAAGECVPGSVMVIGERALLEPCTREYDKRTVGIISGAGPFRPAITLGESESDMPTVAIAMVGTAFCLVDAENTPIEAGDLLTSSSTPGHAMKAVDQIKSFGAIIGKALASLPHGRGLVPIIVALQ